jgi:dynein heavy chain 2, cytosolic
MQCRKLVALFGLSKQLLTPQQHYDWGLRALKSCLAIAGRLLHEGKLAAAATPGSAMDASDKEVELITRAVRLCTTPKLTSEDSTR